MSAPLNEIGLNASSASVTPNLKKLPFSSSERELIVTLVLERPVIQDKRTNAKNIQLKKQAWQELTVAYNAQPYVCHRSSIQLKRCWENMKTQRKKELSPESSSLTQTGGGPPLGGPSSSSDVINTICPHINYKVPGVIDSNTIEILDDLKTTNFENVENPNELETGLTVKRKQKFEFFDLQESIEIEMKEAPDKYLEHVLPQLKKKCTKENRSTSASSKKFLNETEVRIKHCCLNIEQDQALHELRMQREQILIEREKNLLQFERQMQNLQLENLKLEIKLLKKGIIKSFIIHIYVLLKI